MRPHEPPAPSSSSSGGGRPPESGAGFTDLPPEFFRLFPPDLQQRYLQTARGLSPQAPVVVLPLGEHGRRARIAVVAYDHPGEFSWITGLIAARRVVIQTGDVFTFALPRGRETSPRSPRPGRRIPLHRRRVAARQAGGALFATPRRIVDVFDLSGIAAALEPWCTDLEQDLRECFRRLAESADPDAALGFVNSRVAESILSGQVPAEQVLYPLDIRIAAEPDRTGTRVTVRGQDTTAFLYCLSNAFAVQRINIESVRIRTISGQVLDTFRVTDAAGRPLREARDLDRLRVAILVTKQFSHFLGSAPDPLRALRHFKELLERLQDDRRFVGDLFRRPEVFRNLARVLGAGDFLWEDFIRRQYENLLPILRPGGARFEIRSRVEYRAELAQQLAGAQTWEERVARLNRYKDNEIVRLDLAFLVDPGQDLDKLAEGLTRLAEAVIETALEISREELARRYGLPRNFARRVCPFTVLGLGKLGGRELGFGSDLELLCIYAEQGRTDGPESIDAGEFYARLVERMRKAVIPRREGTFELDLRLRPYGRSGPLACRLDAWCAYYAPTGPALVYERQALVKLRRIAGDSALGERVEAFRDQTLFHGRSVPADLYRSAMELRRRQNRELVKPGRINLKYGAGGLVDIEYTVQILQILYAHKHTEIQSPNTRAALAALCRFQIVDESDGRALLAAHDLLRRLINAVRMLRGHAGDLDLPRPGTLEMGHLARRMGYRTEYGRSAGEHLGTDVAAAMAFVRDFRRRWFPRGSLVTRETGNLADVALADDMPPDLIRAILERTGFQDPECAATNLRLLARKSPDRETFCQLVVLAEPLLRASPDADMALNNWERFAETIENPNQFFAMLFREPQKLEFFLRILGTSQFLADTLMRHPESLDWLLDPKQLLESWTPDELARDVTQRTTRGNLEERLDALRRARRLHHLRIAVRDLCVRVPFEETVRDLSILLDTLIRAVFRLHAAVAGMTELLDGGRLIVLAFGKLGGRELNYSSDVDLFYYLRESGAPSQAAAENAATLCRQVNAALAAHTAEGSICRVDMRLRPFGRGGRLVPTQNGLIRYYQENARPIEFLALLKSRPILDASATAAALRERLLAIGLDRYDFSDFAGAAERARDAARAACEKRMYIWGTRGRDIKSGWGGIRDIEFAVQLRQLQHLRRFPDLAEPGTLDAIHRLVEHELLDPDTAGRLRERYIFLRRIEHLLQLMDDRQIHFLQLDSRTIKRVVRRLDTPGLTAEHFEEQLDQCMQANYGFFTATTAGPP